MTEIWLYNFQQIKPCKNQCSNLRHQKEEEVVEVWWDAGRQGGIIGQKNEEQKNYRIEEIALPWVSNAAYLNNDY